MKYIFAAALAVTCLASCDEPKQNPIEDAPTDEMNTEEFGAFEGDLSFDAAHDELAVVIEGIVKRNDELAKLTGFSSVDVPSVRANIVILTNLISTFEGGAAQIGRNRFEGWERAVISAFEDPNRWGYQPWPEEEKKAWRLACEEDLNQLRKVLAESWAEEE